MPTTEASGRVWSSRGTAYWIDYVRRLAIDTVRGFLLHDGFTTSAALAFNFLLSLFPFLIFLANALALLPIRHLAVRMIQLASHFVPDTTMPMVESMLKSTMRPNQGLLSAGFILTVIAASNAVAVMATLLDVIYGVKGAKGFWKQRLNAIGTTVVVGVLTMVALSAMLLGPHFARELERVFNASHTFTIMWPTLRWVLALTCGLASIEALYYLGVSRKHSLRQQLPGSLFAVAVWIGSSWIMGIYFRRFSYVNAMYGTLTSMIILAIWLQLTAMAILLGAELNVEMEKHAKALDPAAQECPKVLSSLATESKA